MKNETQKLLGLLFIVIGIVLFIFCLGEFVLRLLGALFALWLISLGMRMNSIPFMYFFSSRFINRR